MKSNKNLLRQIIASQHGAVIMLAVYGAFVTLLYIFGLYYYELPVILKILYAPANLFVGIEPSSMFIMGLPVNIILISAVMYAALGYLYDWFVDPYK